MPYTTVATLPLTAVSLWPALQYPGNQRIPPEKLGGGNCSMLLKSLT